MRSTIVRKGALAAAILSLGTLLASCGGGGGGGGTTTGGTTLGGTSSGGTSSGGTTSTGTYLAYVGYNQSPGLYLVDPSNPTSPITVTTMPALNYEPLIVAGNTSNSSYTNLHVQEIDYLQASSTASTSGPLMKVSLVKNGSTPSPTPISNLTNVTQIVNSWEDEVNEINYMEVQASSGQYYLVNSQMSPTDNPIPLNNMQIIDEIGGSNQPITGFLVQSGNTLEECNTSLGSCSPVANANSVTNVTEMATNPSNGTMFLCVDGNVDELSGSTLTSIGVSCSNIQQSFTRDNQNIYAVDNNGNILELSFSNPSAGWEPIYINSSGLNISIDYMTQNYLIIHGYNNNNSTSSLIAIPKSGGSSITFYTFGNGENEGLEFSLSNQFLFTVFNNQGSVSACVWTEGSSSPSCNANSYWAGESIATSGSINYAFSYHFTPYKILEVENVTNIFQGGGALYAVDPSNLSSQTLVGSIPSNYTFFNGLGIGNTMLLYGINIQQNYSPNVFFTNLSSNTLIQIPNAIGTPVF